MWHRRTTGEPGGAGKTIAKTHTTRKAANQQPQTQTHQKRPPSPPPNRPLHSTRSLTCLDLPCAPPTPSTPRPRPRRNLGRYPLVSHAYRTGSSRHLYPSRRAPSASPPRPPHPAREKTRARWDWPSSGRCCGCPTPLPRTSCRRCRRYGSAGVCPRLRPRPRRRGFRSLAAAFGGRPATRPEVRKTTSFFFGGRRRRRCRRPQ